MGVLLTKIPLPENEPEAYLEPTDKTFSLKSPSINTVYNLLRSIDEKKSVRLNKIPSKLLKIASYVVAPSLTAIFAPSISRGMFPQQWKTSWVSPVYKSGTRKNPSNYPFISVNSVIAKILEKIGFFWVCFFFNRIRHNLQEQ